MWNYDHQILGKGAFWSPYLCFVQFGVLFQWLDFQADGLNGLKWKHVLLHLLQIFVNCSAAFREPLFVCSVVLCTWSKTILVHLVEKNILLYFICPGNAAYPLLHTFLCPQPNSVQQGIVYSFCLFSLGAALNYVALPQGLWEGEELEAVCER